MKNPRISKNLKRQIRDYNTELEPLPEGIQKLQNRMITGCGWNETDGEFPGVFNDGRGVLWSVTWVCSDRVVKPRDYWPTEYQPAEAVIYEMLDYATYETTIGRQSGRSMLYLKFMLDLKACESGTKSVEGLMTVWKPKLFGQFREHIWVYDPPTPAKIKQINLRPGWPEEQYELPPVMMTTKPMTVTRKEAP